MARRNISIMEKGEEYQYCEECRDLLPLLNYEIGLCDRCLRDKKEAKDEEIMQEMDSLDPDSARYAELEKQLTC